MNKLEEKGFIRRLLDPESDTSSSKFAMLVVVFWTMLLVTVSVIHTINMSGVLPYKELTYLLIGAMTGKALSDGAKKINIPKSKSKEM